jgi:hypothetical protein
METPESEDTFEDQSSATEEEAPELGMTESALEDTLGLTLFDDGIISYSGGLGGKSENVVRSTTCKGFQRSYAEASYLSGRGDCYLVGWYSQDESDCRIVVHYGVPPLKSGSCSWKVYANQIGYYSYTTSNTNSAQQNTIDTQIILQDGNVIEVGTCGLPNASASGDTYLRLIGPSGQTAALNDDACNSLSSYMVYTVPPGGGGKYKIKAGCYSSASCSGTVAWQIR